MPPRLNRKTLQQIASDLSATAIEHSGRANGYKGHLGAHKLHSHVAKLFHGLGMTDQGQLHDEHAQNHFNEAETIRQEGQGGYKKPELPAVKKQPKSSPGQLELFSQKSGTQQMVDSAMRAYFGVSCYTLDDPFTDPVVDEEEEEGEEEDYGFADAIKKTARNTALGAGIALSALGGGCAKTDSCPTDQSGFTDSGNVQTRLNQKRSQINAMRARSKMPNRPGTSVMSGGGKVKSSWSPGAESAARSAAQEMQSPLDF